MRKTWLQQLLSLIPIPVLLAGMLCGAAMSQSSVRGWGVAAWDTESRMGPIVDIAVQGVSTFVLRADGRGFVNGSSNYLIGDVPELAAGLSYVQVATDGRMGGALVSDGSIRTWGVNPGFWPLLPLAPSAPPLPPGISYLEVEVGDPCLALRSDYQVVAWGNSNQYGQLNVPVFPSGTVATKLVSARGSAFALLSDGSIVGWGDSSSGLLNVPPLPAGVSYTDLSFGLGAHLLALRSDGQIASWGDNQFGQLNVPSLSGGAVYTHAAAGDLWSCAMRSDGILVAWGIPWIAVTPPTVPAGLTVQELDAGFSHGVALLSDGSLLAWGGNTYSEAEIPIRAATDRYMDTAVGYGFYMAALANGGVTVWGGSATPSVLTVPSTCQQGRFVELDGLFQHAAALRADGELFCWGNNTYGECNVPAAPVGVHYIDVAVGTDHSIAVRSDGQAVAWGNPYGGATAVPALPPGASYEKCSAHQTLSMLLRSDGEIVAFGLPPLGTSQLNVPSLPPGLKYVDVAAGNLFSLAVLSDGTAAWWGCLNSSVPYARKLTELRPLPFGVAYVEVATSKFCGALRRSDGLIDVCGDVLHLANQPPLDPGTSYVGIHASYHDVVAARVGPTSTYVGVAHGCAGSMSATRLVPSETPRIGATLSVRLFDLPVDVAVMGMGLSRRDTPVSLASIGMPGCDLAITVDAVQGLVGQNNQAQWSLPIPDQPALVGLRFYNQAFVLDPNAGNGLGAVLSNASEGVVGHW